MAELVNRGYSRAILMGDPSEFRIKRGANPHTRNRWGFKRRVDRVKAQEQWRAMKETLSRFGVRIFVLPADPEFPGLVFPANAGYTLQTDIACPLSRRTFILSNLNPARKGEGSLYSDFVKSLGLMVEQIHSPFEGEADLIRWGDKYLFTYGDIIKPRWVPRLGLPPWKRCYGFRSAHNAIHELSHWIPPEQVLSIRLIDERFYHGDTVFCAFGPNRRFLLANERAIAPVSRRILHQIEDIIWLNEKDAMSFAANSFPIRYKGQEILFMPGGISIQLVKQIEALDVQVVVIDVSEFLVKGGGAVKCMIGDLGAWQSEPTTEGIAS